MSRWLKIQLHFYDTLRSKTRIFGWSVGGCIGLRIAIRHPSFVRKLALSGVSFNNDGIYPEAIKFLENSTLEDFNDLKDIYDKTAPNPENWPTLITKVKKMWVEFKGWPQEDIRSVKAHTLIMIGDADIIRPEHAVEMFRLIPHAQLAVLPLTDHFVPV